MLNLTTLLRKFVLVLSEPRDTTYFKNYNKFFQCKECLKLFGQVLLRRAHQEFSQIPVSWSISSFLCLVHAIDILHEFFPIRTVAAVELVHATNQSYIHL